MSKDYQEIDEPIQRWLKRQHVFFVSTAPRADDGMINCSPKGLNGLRVIGPKKIVYADIGGSGIETVAHLKENGRIVIMLCAFEGPPKIFRFFGTGRVVEPHVKEFADLKTHFPELPTIRNFIVVKVERIMDSCGFGVPEYDYKGERDSLVNWSTAKSEQEHVDYRIDRNATSLEGLPGLEVEKMR